ncbi:MAG: hypothetical protein IH840_01400 [Candidatus Heimdallarchaeota archaeon]|nr:hypothetical protein [Candidatus Heimdallarchaeota archaeon]
MDLNIAEVCIVANLQTMGPLYVTDAGKGFFDNNSGMLLAARIIITSGMGNQASGMNKLHGPVPIPELELDQQYLCYFYINEMTQKPNPDTPYSTGKGTYIVCIVIPEEIKNDIRPYEKQIEDILNLEGKGIEFSETMSGELTTKLTEDISVRMKSIFEHIMQSFDLAPLFEATSLFNLGLIANLPPHISIIAKKLILNPKGLPERDLKDNKVVNTLINADLVTRVTKDGESWLIPR